MECGQLASALRLGEGLPHVVRSIADVGRIENGSGADDSWESAATAGGRAGQARAQEKAAASRAHSKCTNIPFTSLEVSSCR